MLKLKNIKTFYGNIQALKGISIDISEGEIITLIGANGAGKTTTLMSISGIVPPRSGKILFLHCFPSWPSGGIRPAEPSAAASSRCWPSPGH